MTKMNLTKDAARNWKSFVADCLVAMTARKADRELVGGYQVRRVSGGYLILFAGTTSYSTMTAEQIYDWAARLPLQYFVAKADDLRADILGA